MFANYSKIANEGEEKENMFAKYSTRKCNYMALNLTDGMTGLGNRMWAYASFFGTALRNDKVPLTIQKGLDLYNSFKLSVPNVADNFNFSTFKKGADPEHGCCRFIEAANHLDCGTNITFDGFRQSWKYFEKSFNEIRQEYRFIDNVSKACDDTLNVVLKKFKATWENSILIGAHMRRGDFLKPNFAGYGFSPATEDYYNESVNYFEKRFNNSSKTIIFLILGNDYPWNVKNAPKAKNLIVLEPQDRTVDLCIVSRCNHTIISAGTFGWWAAFLNKGETVYMKEQCRPGSALCSEFDMDSYISPKFNWVPL